jgi:hypothetical protein
LPHLGLSSRRHPFDIYQRSAKAHKPQFQSLFSLEPNAKFSGAGAKRRAPTAKLLASAATQC